MATITTINAGDNITDSRTVINTNFSNLNSDKIETSTLDTDTTLAANSDAKIPTQKAVKAYVDAGGNVNASTTGKGIVEEATQAEVDAGTATGGTSARLYVNPSTLPVILTAVPKPLGFVSSAVTGLQLNSDTTAHLALYSIPHRIVVNKISFNCSAHTSGGAVDLSLFSEDGQTRLFSVTSASVSGTGVVTTAVSAVAVAPGNYWLCVNNDAAGANFQVSAYQTAAPLDGASSLTDIASEPVITGTLAITSGTPPTTITPGSITVGTSQGTIFRLDN